VPAKNRKHAISFKGVQSLTKQSFKDECDYNAIIDRYTRTGKIEHVARITPQYGVAPDMTLHEAACINAELRSHEAEAEMPGLDDLDAPEDSQDDSEESVTDSEPENAEKALADPAQESNEGAEV